MSDGLGAGTQSVFRAGKEWRRAMDTAPVNEIGRIAYLGNLMALIQLYLEFNLSVTDSILAAESDLVTWKITGPARATEQGLSEFPDAQKVIRNRMWASARR